MQNKKTTDINAQNVTASKDSAPTNHNKHFLNNWRAKDIYLMLFDVASVIVAYFLALWLRFDCRFSEIPHSYLAAWLKFIPIYAVVSIVVLWNLRLYQSIWKFASFVELERITLATAILGVFHTIFITVFFERMPITYYILGIIIQ